MEITIKEKTFELKKSFRAMIAFEAATGRAFSPRTVTDTIMYFYCVVMSSCPDLEVTYDEFMDWLDETPTLINDFSEWIVKVNEVEQTLNKAKKKTLKVTKTSKK